MISDKALRFSLWEKFTLHSPLQRTASPSTVSRSPQTTPSGGHCDFTTHLQRFGLPWRWMGFMVDPALIPVAGDSVTSETTTTKKVSALSSRLTAAGFHSHAVFMLAAHRMHKFFGADQS